MQQRAQLRSRDFVLDRDGVIYAVVGYYSQDSETIYGLPKYIPSPTGSRIRCGIRYSKLDFDECIHRYGERALAPIPRSQIQQIFKPEFELLKIPIRFPEFSKLLEVMFPLIPNLGITGSWLCGLEDRDSDIDLVAYGNYYVGAKRILNRAMLKGLLEPLSEDDWRETYRKRKPGLSFEEYLLHETRKQNRWKFGERYLDLLYSRSWDQAFQELDPTSQILGKCKISAKIIDDSFVFDLPAVYILDHPKISKILCFLHSYAGQGFKGETIQAQGILERSGNQYRLIVGTHKYPKDEWIRCLDLVSRYA